MNYISKFLGVAVVTLMIATNGLPLSLSIAEDTLGKKANSEETAKHTDTSKAVPAKSAEPYIKNEKRKPVHRIKRRSGLDHSDKARVAETAPGERLSIRQVLELLKTTRNFSGRNLSGLRLVGFDLTKCNLKCADLSNTNLERADLEEANLELADLSGANMKMTDLRVTGLKGARLDRTILDGAIWKDGTVCLRGSIGLCREHNTKFVSK